jgi:hypothetical protein
MIPVSVFPRDWTALLAARVSTALLWVAADGVFPKTPRCASVETPMPHLKMIARRKTVGDRNQVSSFYLAGDLPDLQTFQIPVADHDF